MDWKALSNAAYARDVDMTYRGALGPVYRVVYDTLSFESRQKIFNMSIPQTLVLSNLRLTAFTKNVDDAELKKLQWIPPFAVEAAPFELKIVGKNSTVIISADKAVVKGSTMVGLSGNVEISVGGASKKISSSVLSIEGRTLRLRTQAGKGLDMKF